MDKEKFLQSGLMELYVLGLASPEEQEIVMDFALAYPDIQETLSLSVEALEEYAKAHSMVPPKSLRNKIRKDLDDAGDDKIQAMNTEKREDKKVGFLLPLLSVGMVIFGILAGLTYKKNQEGAKQYEDLQKEYAIFKENCEENQELQKTMSLEYNFLKDKNTTAVNLIGTELSPDAKAVVFWNINKKASYLKVINLPDPPKDNQYQLWADIDGEMVDLGAFELAENSLIKINFKEKANSLNVTLEKVGGVPNPTIDRLYVSGSL